jgi:hypothetical protein
VGHLTRRCSRRAAFFRRASAAHSRRRSRLSETFDGMAKPRYTCPCCGYLAFKEMPGSYEICHVCFWEDDPVQLMDPWFAGGANRPNLVEAQQAYARIGAMEARFTKNVRGIQPSDERDATWRLVAPSDREHVRTPASLSEEEYRRIDAWYYWRRDAV